MILIVLVAKSGTGRWQQKLCEQALSHLANKNIPHAVVDGMEDGVVRNHLFAHAGSQPAILNSSLKRALGTSTIWETWIQ